MVDAQTKICAAEEITFFEFGGGWYYLVSSDVGLIVSRSINGPEIIDANGVLAGHFAIHFHEVG